MYKTERDGIFGFTLSKEKIDSLYVITSFFSAMLLEGYAYHLILRYTYKCMSECIHAEPLIEQIKCQNKKTNKQKKTVLGINSK